MRSCRQRRGRGRESDGRRSSWSCCVSGFIFAWNGSRAEQACLHEWMNYCNLQIVKTQKYGRRRQYDSWYDSLILSLLLPTSFFANTLYGQFRIVIKLTLWPCDIKYVAFQTPISNNSNLMTRPGWQFNSASSFYIWLLVPISISLRTHYEETEIFASGHDSIPDLDYPN